jgi:hypothetical protein
MFSFWITQHEYPQFHQENAQLCGGKPTHPFFSQLKATQQSVISSGVNTNLSAQQTSSLDGYELLPAPPFHITQLVEVIL